MLGKDLLIAHNGRVLAGQRTCSLNITQDTIEVCSPVSGPWREYKPSTTGWQVSCAGLVLSPEHAEELIVLITSRQRLRLSFYDQEMRCVRSGYALPTSLDGGADIGSLASYSMTFQGSGPLDKVSGVPLELEFYHDVNDIDFKSDENHALYHNDGADLAVRVFTLSKMSRVEIRTIGGVVGSVACLIPLGETEEDSILDVLESADNLRYFNMEIAHVGWHRNSIPNKAILMLKPGRYAMIQEVKKAPLYSIYAISLPTE